MSSRVAEVRTSLWIAYRYTSTPGVIRGTIEMGYEEFWLKRNILEYVAGLALFEISVVVHYCTRRLEPSSSADDERTVDLDVVA